MPSMSLVYDSVNVGDELPPLSLPPLTRTTLALYAGASGDHNPMHIDIDFARAAGMPDVFAHGMLSMAWLGRLLTEWAPQRDLREFSVRFTAMTHVGERIVCTGRVTREARARRRAAHPRRGRHRERGGRSQAHRRSAGRRVRTLTADARMTASYPASARAARPRLHDAHESRADGVDAHRPRGGGGRLRADGGVLRGTRPRRRRAHRHRRHRAELRGPRRAASIAAVVSVAGGQAPHHHRRRARGRRQDRDADPACGALRVSPAVGRAVGHPLADHAVQAARAVALGHRQDDRGLCPLRAARAARGLRRRRDHGLGRLSHQRVRRAAHQPSHRRLGRHVRRTGCAFRSRSCAARARRSVADFIIIFRLSMLDLVDGGSTWDEVVALAKAVEAAGRHDHQHRHRLA